MTNVIIAGGSAGAPAMPRGRLIFALDATASRGPTWDAAVPLTEKMFQAVAPIGALSTQLIFFRGDDQCSHTPWVSSGVELARLMRMITVNAGKTQILRVLAHAQRETQKIPVQRLIFIGDSVEENIDELAGAAAELGRLGVPVDMFLEGHDPTARAAFRLIALRSGGQFHQFGISTPQAVAQLAAKLNDVAKLAVQNATLLTHRSD
jgi:hypothetical protein